MKFGQEYTRALASEDFPEHWLESAIEYKNLKKCIKKIHTELEAIGLTPETLAQLSEYLDKPVLSHTLGGRDAKGYYSASLPHLDSIPEEFTPQLRVLVDSTTGRPLDATLAPETRAALQKLARHEIVTAGRRLHLAGPVQHPPVPLRRRASQSGDSENLVAKPSEDDARWVQLPLASARDFFDLLEPKLQELEILRLEETERLENNILEVGDAVENVVEPVRQGFEATRSLSHRDLYFWREMFRLYMEKPIFYSETEARRGALTFTEAKQRLYDYDQTLRNTGLLAKMRTPQAKIAAQQFLNLNVDILKIMHFQEMNARAMTKILKKFDKRTHLEGQVFLQSLQSKYPGLVASTSGNPNAALAPKNTPGAFATSIARDLHAELGSKVLAIIPQLDDWNCPVCYSMAWRPINLGCCRSRFCITCIIELQEKGMKRCPMCNTETIMAADARCLDLEAMRFLQKFFPLETRTRQKENEKEALKRQTGEEVVKPCVIM